MLLTLHRLPEAESSRAADASGARDSGFGMTFAITPLVLTGGRRHESNLQFISYRDGKPQDAPR